MSSQPATSNPAKRANVKRITNGKHKRSVSSGPNKRPAFILKLWTMVNDPKNEDYIQWAPDGESFKVLSKENFEKVVLPKYFKHSNYSSFVRQLNMYGWHKVQDITSGAMQSGDEIRQFKSPYFIRDREDLLDNIVRNKGSKGSDDEDESDIGRILDELDLIKSNQMEIASDLNRIRSDNQLLWRECYESRERHKAHAETFERILRFLASLYSNNQNKFVSDGLSPAQKQQRLLLPNLNELSNGQISELSSHNIPLSTIEDLISNGAGSDKFGTPSKSNRISSISNDDVPRISSHISDADTPQSEHSPQSLWSDTNEESKTLDVAKPKKTKARASLTYQSLPTNENNIYTSPNPSLNTPLTTTTSPNFTANPSSLQKLSTNYDDTLSLPFTNPLSQDSISATDGVDSRLSLVPLSDPFATLTSSSNMDPLTSGASDNPVASLVTDALFETNQDLMHDNRRAQHLLNSSQDLDSIIRNINYQGDSLQRIQDRLQKFGPLKDENPLGSPPTDPTFDVDEFLMNSTSDMLDGSVGDAPFEEMGPPQKRSKFMEER